MVQMPERLFMFLSSVSLVTQHGIVRFEFGIMPITLIVQLNTPKSKTVFFV